MITFTVTGIPEPQGSARGFLVNGRVIITSDNPDLKKWRATVSAAANIAMLTSQQAMTHNAVQVDVRFYFERPKSVSKKVFHKTTRPDTDKLVRAVLDSLSGIVYLDDAQVVAQSGLKYFGSPARCQVSVRVAPIEDELPLFCSLRSELSA